MRLNSSQQPLDIVGSNKVVINLIIILVTNPFVVVVVNNSLKHTLFPFLPSLSINTYMVTCCLLNLIILLWFVKSELDDMMENDVDMSDFFFVVEK